MNPLLKKCAILGALFLVLGISGRLYPERLAKPRTEAWMQKTLPTNLTHYTFLPDAPGSPYSYKMDARTYSLLHPYGIVARIFTDGAHRYDSVVVMGNQTDNFHDPNLCFPSQDWIIESEKPVVITLASGLRVNMHLMHVTLNGVSNWCCYFFSGPNGTYTSIKDLSKAFLFAEITFGRQFQGGFYRFMTLSPHDTPQDLLKFTTDYLNHVPKSADLG